MRNERDLRATIRTHEHDAAAADRILQLLLGGRCQHKQRAAVVLFFVEHDRLSQRSSGSRKSLTQTVDELPEGTSSKPVGAGSDELCFIAGGGTRYVSARAH